MHLMCKLFEVGSMPLTFPPGPSMPQHLLNGDKHRGRRQLQAAAPAFIQCIYLRIMLQEGTLTGYRRHELAFKILVLHLEEIKNCKKEGQEKNMQFCSAQTGNVWGSHTCTEGLLSISFLNLAVPDM